MRPMWSTQLLAALVVAVPLSAQTPAPAAPPAGGPPPAPKNLKVLTGASREELIRTMQLMSASLGVRCDFCHVEKDGELDFPNDSKEEKDTAREMIQMTQQVNKTTFEGRPAVSCYTCHQGSPHPVSILPLPVSMPPMTRPAATPNAAPGAPNAAPEAKPATPTAEAVISGYLKSMPSKTARVLRGNAVTARGAMPIEVVQSGDRMLVTIKGAQGETQQYSDGKSGWVRDAKGTHAMSPMEIARFNDATRALALPKLDPKAEGLRANTRKEKVGDRELIRVDRKISDDLYERYYFDPATNALVRSMRIISTPVGRTPQQVDYNDYRDVNGMRVPFSVRSSSADARNDVERKFDVIEYPEKVDESRFVMPK